MLYENSKRADELDKEFESGFDEIVKRVWPNMKVVVSLETDTDLLNSDRLQRVHCKGLPIYSPLYSSAGGYIGINLWPKVKQQEYALIPFTSFFEFIQEEDMDKRQPRTFQCHQVY